MEINRSEDPTKNVRDILEAAVDRIDDLREREVKRIDEKIDANDVKYQIQFCASKEAVTTALVAQEKGVAAALENTREAINKAEATTDKRFDLLSEKIDGIGETISKTSGEKGIYVTHTDLQAEMEKLRLSFEAMLRPVVTFMNAQTGKSSGYNAGWLYLIGAVSLLSTIISVFHALTEK